MLASRLVVSLIAIVLIALFACVGGIATKGAADNPATVAMCDKIGIYRATANTGDRTNDTGDQWRYATKPDNPCASPERTGMHIPNGWRPCYRS